MSKRLFFGLAVIAVAVAAFLIFRGGGGKSPTTTTKATPAATVGVKAYFYRDAALVPVVVKVPATKAVATAALEALLKGPPAGLESSIPPGAKLASLTISGGTATARFTQSLAGAPRTAQAQVVDTLTQFPSVHAVVIATPTGPVALADGSGRTLLRPATRADYVDLTPDAPILVEAPNRGSTVSSPVQVSGTALVFEGTFALEVREGEKLLHTYTITASSGAPDRGSWTKTLLLAPGSYRLVLYEPSAEDGSHLHTTSVDFRVRR